MHKLGGIYPALLTPFFSDGSINYKELKRLARWNLDQGVKGFYVGGSTAECFLLTTDERKKVLDAVVEETNGEGVILSHIGSISECEAIDLAKHAKSAGADVISSIAPFYFGFSSAEIHQYYLDIVDAVDLPMLVYHFPDNSGVQMTLEQANAYLSDPRFVGIKYTSGDLFLMGRIRYANPDSVIFNGRDEICLSGLAAGADGAIGSTYNFMASKFIAIQKAFQNNELAEAQRLQKEAINIIDALCRVGVMPGEKAALNAMGFNMGTCRKPFRAATEEESAMLARVMKENGVEF